MTFDFQSRKEEFHNVYRDHGCRCSEAMRVWSALCIDLADVIGMPTSRKTLRAVHDAYEAEQRAVLAGQSMEEIVDLVKARQAAWAVVAELVEEAPNA